LGLTAVPPAWLLGPGPEVATARFAPGGPAQRLVLLALDDERLTPIGRLLVAHLSAWRAGQPDAGGEPGGGQQDGRSSIGGRSA
ncbi:MAG: hypothetical protein ACRDK8_10255, partial [Solirubrobacteraceae bacterium]